MGEQISQQCLQHWDVQLEAPGQLDAYWWVFDGTPVPSGSQMGYVSNTVAFSAIPRFSGGIRLCPWLREGSFGVEGTALDMAA